VVNISGVRPVHSPAAATRHQAGPEHPTSSDGRGDRASRPGSTTWTTWTGTASPTRPVGW